MRLDHWYVPEGAIAEAASRLARLSAGGLTYDLSLRFRCLIENQAVAEGALVHPGGTLAELLGEGEEVPAGFRYCTLEQRVG
jgi:hypothetical protein